MTLAGEQSEDNDFDYIAKYLAKKPAHEKRPQKHDKHASFTVKGPKSPVREGQSSTVQPFTSRLPSNIVTQHRNMRREPAAALNFETGQPAAKVHTKLSSDDAFLSDIKTKLESRPKTSAAACIDYTEPISPISNRTNSNRSNRTAYSTPYTSAGITPGATSKRFSQSVPNVSLPPEIDNSEFTALPKFPGDTLIFDADGEQVVDPRIRHLEVCQPHHLFPQNPLPTPSRIENSISRSMSRTRSRANSIRRSIKEYMVPGSSSSAQSIHSVESNTDPSKPRGRLSALKSKISSGSLRSRVSRAGYDDGDEYFIDADQLDLDRPLPPLPGLDSYREKPKHIGQMMKSLLTPNSSRRPTHNVVIDDNGIERAMTLDEEAQRKEDLARACMEKMSMGSIGSKPTSPTNQSVSKHAAKASIDDSLRNASSRPVTACSGNAPGSVPLYKTTSAYRAASGSLGAGLHKTNEERVEDIRALPRVEYGEPKNRQQSASAAKMAAAGGFVKRLGSKIGFKRKAKVVALV